MSNKTNNGNAGLREETDEPTVALFGDDLTSLTSVSEINEDGSSATETFNGKKWKYALESLTEPQDAHGQVSNGPECCNSDGDHRPCVSRVIDANGNATIKIILGYKERSEYLPLVTALIDSASENDVVDLTVVANVSGEAGTISQRSILSALDSCKGHVITRAGTITTMGDAVIWLSGDECRMPKMGAIFMRQPISGFVGDAVDYERKAKDFRESLKEFSDYIVARGLFTQEEIDTMYESCGLLSLYGDALHERLANLKQVHD